MKTRPYAQRGQALLIAIVVLFFVALSMYLIATLGRHVQQKIHAQTTADATALSLATMEAETMNYIAFANRAQVAQYVTALNVQAYVSYLSWWEVLAADVSLNAKFLLTNPYTAAIGTALINAANAFKSAVSPVVDAFDAAEFAVDKVVGIDNQALWVTEIVAAEITNAHLLSGGLEFFEQNTQGDPDPWTYTTADIGFNAALGIYNAARFNDAFGSAGGTPLMPTTNTSDGPLDRVMTEEVNATRADSFLLARGVVPPFGPEFSAFVNFINLILGKNGQSKLISQTDPSSISRTAQDDSKLTTGVVMASRDHMFSPLLILLMPTTGGTIDASVWEKSTTSQHCRAKDQVPQCLDQGQDTNHSYGGISPYMTFQAGLRSNGNAGEDFHQPDVLVWLNKNSVEASLTGATPISFAGSATIDTRSGANQLLPDGINVISRAQAYYHRPGNWREPPNLFNPFWHARLAPVADAISAAGSVPELAPLQQLIGTVVITH